MITCTHSGHRYTFTPKVKIHRLEGRLIAVRYRGMQAGVWIESLATGEKVWRDNDSYPHITGLPFNDPTTRQTKP